MTEREIFTAALNKGDPAERVAYLNEVCADDAELRQRVESLLAEHAHLGSFLESPAVERPTLSDDVTSEVEALSSLESEMPLDFLLPSQQPGHLGRLGHYEVIEVIGRGGMGIVLRAIDDKLQRVVAIKVMAAQLATSAAARKRFMREAQAAAAVSHDHIVTIHAVEEARGVPCLAMQYVSGQSLQQRLDKSGSLELREIVRIGMQMASGVAAAHAQGLIHRDIKPANILLENGVERVKITDFGLARAVADASVTQTGMVAGTPQYMSPEQARGEQVDRRSDLFSLGSVLYAMCTGRPPFRADSGIAVLRRVCDDTPRPIRELNPDLPLWLITIVGKLQAKDPAERYQTAAEVAEVLSHHLAEVQHPSLALAVVEKSASASPARLRWAVAAVVLLCLLVGLGMAEGTGVTKLASTVIRLFTPEGTLVIEVDDENVVVQLDGEELSIKGAGPHEIRLQPGKYQLQATKDGKIAKQELISITRGGHRVVSITREPLTVATVPPVVVPRLVLRGHTSWVESLAFSPDGKTLATGCNDQGVRLWDTKTGDLTGKVHADEGLITSVAYSPDGKVLVSTSSVRKVRVWNAATLKPLAEFKDTDAVRTVAFRPSDSMLATACWDKTVKIWKWDGAALVPIRTLSEHSAAVNAMSFNPEGTLIAAATTDGMLYLWDVESGKQLKSARIHEWPLCLAFSPDGKTVAVAGFDKRIELCKVDTLESVGTLRGHKDWVTSLVYLADGQTLVSVGGYFDPKTQTSDRPGEFRLWDVAGLKERLSVDGYEGIIRAVALSPDGQTLATGDFAGQARLWNVAALQTATRADGNTDHAAVSRLDETAHAFSLALDLTEKLTFNDAERLRILDQIVASDEMFQRVLKLRPQVASLWHRRVNYLAEQGRWEEAADCCRKRLEVGTDGLGFWSSYAVAALAANDAAAYRQVCKKMLDMFPDNFEDHPYPQEAWYAAWATAIAPDSVEDKQKALRVAEAAMSGIPNSPLAAWVYAAWLYRVDRLAESVACWETAARDDHEVVRFCFLAMAHHRLGHADLAGQFAEQGRKPQRPDQASWFGRVYWQQVVREMEGVLKAPSDAAASEANDPVPGTPPRDGGAESKTDHSGSDP